MNTLLVFLGILFIDRFSKAWAFKTLADTSFAPFYGCNIVLTWNKGISWSLFASDSPVALYILTSVIALTIAIFMWYTLRRALQFQPIIFETLALAGALSNLIDRLFYGAVIDFIQLYAGSYSFPVFNIADVAIFIGACGMMVQTWRSQPHGCFKSDD
jgi:signal peptidase II